MKSSTQLMLDSDDESMQGYIQNLTDNDNSSRVSTPKTPRVSIYLHAPMATFRTSQTLPTHPGFPHLKHPGLVPQCSQGYTPKTPRVSTSMLPGLHTEPLTANSSRVSTPKTPRVSTSMLPGLHTEPLTANSSRVSTPKTPRVSTSMLPCLR